MKRELNYLQIHCLVLFFHEFKGCVFASWLQYTATFSTGTHCALWFDPFSQVVVLNIEPYRYIWMNMHEIFQPIRGFVYVFGRLWLIPLSCQKPKVYHPKVKVKLSRTLSVNTHRAERIIKYTFQPSFWYINHTIWA